MKFIIFLKINIVVFIMSGCTNNQTSFDAKEIIALETQALELWNSGNPDGFLQLSANDVIYIDPFFERKLEGIGQLKDYYNSIRGQVNVDKYEIIQPTVQFGLDIAVLTYHLLSQSGENVYKWNCTEVYRLNSHRQWQIIHTHWSFIQPNQ